MTDLMTRLSQMRRPRLLLQAARHGLCDYDRDRDLRRVLRCPSCPAPAEAVDALITEETRLEEVRQRGDASYNLTRHIEVLIAMLAELRLMPRVLDLRP
ncbi:DUF6477 family protein [Albidovulum sediminicola]|uniref:DUF6477 family protein n=1 Tax=Albidovulum sediminicola TaxID=2984331 RepID=A0ABT2Z3Q1_9RHOB|nr:DUF6477 family protein [Defluviimonas sp. WL0075]MCV2865700.1 DUF6477 family protein [Defluviimonas sp. WL0075]